MTEFQSALVAAIRKQIAKNRREGITSMSAANLRQITPTPSPSLAGAPRGTNAAYFYAQAFDDACASLGIR